MEFPYLMNAMGKRFGAVLSTVNAPYSIQLDEATLARCLSDFELAKRFSGHVSSFLGELDTQEQIEFASEFGIGAGELKAFSRTFSAWSGERYSLTA